MARKPQSRAEYLASLRPNRTVVASKKGATISAPIIAPPTVSGSTTATQDCSGSVTISFTGNNATSATNSCDGTVAIGE